MEIEKRQIVHLEQNELSNCCGTTCNKGLVLNQLENYKVENQLLKNDLLTLEEENKKLLEMLKRKF